MLVSWQAAAAIAAALVLDRDNPIGALVVAPLLPPLPPTSVPVANTHAPGFERGLLAIHAPQPDLSAWLIEMRKFRMKLDGKGFDQFPDSSPAEIKSIVNLLLRAADAAAFPIAEIAPLSGQLRFSFTLGDFAPAGLNDYGKAYGKLLEVQRVTLSETNLPIFGFTTWFVDRAKIWAIMARFAAEYDAVGSVVLPSFADSLFDSATNLPTTLGNVASDVASFGGTLLANAVASVAFSTPVLLGALAFVWWKYAD